MKTILYLFIAIFTFGILQPAFINKSRKQDSILIQAREGNVSIQQLQLAANIISGRLADFTSEKFEVTIIPGKNQITVDAIIIQNRESVEKLLTQKGVLAFYETYDRTSLSAHLNGDTRLFSLLHGGDIKPSDAKIGCATDVQAKKIDTFLESFGTVKECKFAWELPFEGGNICLFALKTNGPKGAVITGSDIESVKSNPEKASQLQEISIILKKEVEKIWAETTRRNINHSIAIALDDKVLAAPVVRSVIEGGKCSITGKFTPEQARWIAAMGNNGELPLSFTVVK